MYCIRNFITGLTFFLLSSLAGLLIADQNISTFVDGTITSLDRTSEFMVAAPHGSYDRHTGKIVTKICETLLWDCIIANGFNLSGARLNVNRPTEGAGIKSSSERYTQHADLVYKEYKKSIITITGGKPRLYIEVHGSNNEGIEVATNDVPHEHAIKLKAIMNEEWKKISDSEIPIKVQKIDRIKKVNTAVKRFGVVADLSMSALFFELSRDLRDNHANKLVEFLAAVFMRTEMEIYMTQ